MYIMTLLWRLHHIKKTMINDDLTQKWWYISIRNYKLKRKQLTLNSTSKWTSNWKKFRFKKSRWKLTTFYIDDKKTSLVEIRRKSVWKNRQKHTTSLFRRPKPVEAAKTLHLLLLLLGRVEKVGNLFSKTVSLLGTCLHYNLKLYVCIFFLKTVIVNSHAK